MSFDIRKFQFSDLSKVYEICLRTGKSGSDASEMYKDHRLLGHYYAAPYVIVEPDSAFILTKDNIPVGYIVGTKNTVEFKNKCEKLWFPVLRDDYELPLPTDKSPDANIIRLIHKGYLIKKELLEYPAHLHIDILPEAQGKGMGKELMTRFIDHLTQNYVPSLHLEVGKKNIGGIKFYERSGFHIIKEYEHSIAYGIKL